MQVIVIDLGSQLTSLIAKVAREHGVRAEILSPQHTEDWLKNNRPKAIILSGSYASVYQPNAPQPPQEIFAAGCPILGICYGAQWLVKNFNGTVVSSLEKKEYGRIRAVLNDDVIFQDCPREIIAWASHGDSVGELPPDFSAIAWSGDKQVAGFRKDDIYGVMFHPEVTHTPLGYLILSNFLFRISNCVKDWSASDIIAGIQKTSLEMIGENDLIVGAYSGGVDSSTTAGMLVPVLGNRLLGVCIDAGNLREGEIKEIQANAKIIGLNLRIVNAQDQLIAALGNTIDAEEKRKIFSNVYGQSLQQAAGDIGAAWLLQGTIGPDVIETGQLGGATMIKRHHNPILEGVHLNRYDPLSLYFKDEVRDLARALGLPDGIVKRKPFPGPGLIIRVVGCPITAENLAIVRWADYQVSRIVQKHNLADRISQLVVILLGVRTVGVKGDKRVYGFPVVVRAVETVNFMTAEGYRWPAEVCEEMEAVLTQHPDVVRAVFDSTPKPPATIEWE